MTITTNAVGILEREVRELIQYRELNLQDESELVGIVTEAVADYRERFLGGGLPSLSNEDVELLYQRVAGFGAITPFLDDPEVEEIWINEPGRVFVARHGKHELTNVVLGEREVERMVERMLARAGRRLDRSQPFVDAQLPDGTRLHVVIPPITHNWSVNLRKFVGLRANNLDELVTLGSMSVGAAEFLRAAVHSGLNIVVAGAVGAGKTTLLNCLASAIPNRDRVVTCEEVFELQVGLADVVSLQCRQQNLEGQGEITLRDLVRESLRMRPDRLIVGEVRGAEALDMLLAMNSGAFCMTSVHANSAREALRKLTTLPLLAGENVDRQFVASTVAACIDLVVFCRRESGERLVSEVLSVADQLETGNEITAGLMFSRVDGQLCWTGEFPARSERFSESGIDIRSMLASHS